MCYYIKAKYTLLPDNRVESLAFNVMIYLLSRLTAIECALLYKEGNVHIALVVKSCIGMSITGRTGQKPEYRYFLTQGLQAKVRKGNN